MSGAQTKLLHIQRFGLNPVAQHELLVARKLVQLRDQINQQVLQTPQNFVAPVMTFSSENIHRCAGFPKG
jgi:hypothetical protein